MRAFRLRPPLTRQRELVRRGSAAGDGERPGHARRALARELDEEADRLDTLLAAAAKDAHQHLLRLRTGPAAVAAPVLAVTDGGAQRLLGPPARRLDPGDGEEGQEVRALGAQVRQQPAVGRVADPTGEQLVEPGLERLQLTREFLGCERAGGVQVAQGEGSARARPTARRSPAREATAWSRRGSS